MANAYSGPTAKIAAMPALEKTHSLPPSPRRAGTSAGDVTGLSGLGVHIVTGAPGAEITVLPFHRHGDECLFVRSGSATAQIADGDHPIRAGDVIGDHRGGLTHTSVTTGDMPLRSIVVDARARDGVCDVPRLGKRPFHAETLPDMPDALCDLTDARSPSDAARS